MVSVGLPAMGSERSALGWCGSPTRGAGPYVSLYPNPGALLSCELAPSTSPDMAVPIRARWEISHMMATKPSISAQEET